MSWSMACCMVDKDMVHDIRHTSGGPIEQDPNSPFYVVSACQNSFVAEVYAGLMARLYILQAPQWVRDKPIIIAYDSKSAANVITARARYYVWQFKENTELSAMALQEYNKGIRLMQAYSGNPQPSTMTDDRVRFV